MPDKKLKMRPLADRVIVEPLEGEEKTASGILLPETAKEKPQRGTIVSVGPGARDEQGKRVALKSRRRSETIFSMRWVCRSMIWRNCPLWDAFPGSSSRRAST